MNNQSREIEWGRQFKKDYKLSQKRGKDIKKLNTVIEMLCSYQPLPLKFRDHTLSGNYDGHRECHIEPDWLLIYRLKPDVLGLVRLGSHSDLFE